MQGMRRFSKYLCVGFPYVMQPCSSHPAIIFSVVKSPFLLGARVSKASDTDRRLEGCGSFLEWRGSEAAWKLDLETILLKHMGQVH